MVSLEPLMRQNFIEYASYVILDRAIPDLRDGCKPVQRRILHTLFQMNDGKLHKVANVVGETMKLHPHGDASIKDALVVLASKDYFIEKQGNFGNPVTGDPAAAARYIECRLTPLALETLFNKALTDYETSYDGRQQEPVFLPVKLPVVLLLGAEGIAVGMATKVLPHNFVELLRAQIAILRKKPFQLFPDFPTGGVMDVSEYEGGQGRVRVRAKLRASDDKTIVISQIPYQTTTESLIASIESAAQKNKIKVASIQDYTTERVEIEVKLTRGVYADEAIPQLFAYTDCEVSISSSLMVIHEDKPYAATVDQVLNILTKQLVERIRAELEHELGLLQDKHHWLTLERIFIEERVYKSIEKAKTAEAVFKAVWDGMHEFAVLFVRPMVEDDVERLLRIPIRRISAYDIAKSKNDEKEVLAKIREIEKKLAKITQTTIKYLEHLIEKYGKEYPRRTQIATFESVDKKAVARQNIKMSYDPDTGFYGAQVKGSKHTVTISEYDRVLIISADGSYRIIGPVDKLLVGRIIYCAPFDADKGEVFTVVYRDKKRMCFAKKVQIQKFVRDREYYLIKNKEGRIDLLSQADDPGIAELGFPPAPRQRVKETLYDLRDLELTSVTARGTRIAPKAVARVKVMPRKK
ncbi:MAG: DNA topoisomerase IV subunit A [Planctomycetes bacterium]|nr:DNA topoisomerase IV subunit A [Planctomycetota bacterium]